ncbi:hypothetical protein ACF08P_41295 [Streptomyces olivaceoviridis]|uniref:hypothetical protein n=1 Tax=Streptomyces olivaceoviridis TaxID=1921 RepID=UPI0036FC65A7
MRRSDSPPFGTADQGRRLPSCEVTAAFDFEAKPNVDPVVIQSSVSSDEIPSGWTKTLTDPGSARPSWTG